MGMLTKLIPDAFERTKDRPVAKTMFIWGSGGAVIQMVKNYDFGLSLLHGPHRIVGHALVGAALGWIVHWQKLKYLQHDAYSKIYDREVKAVYLAEEIEKRGLDLNQL